MLCRDCGRSHWTVHWDSFHTAWLCDACVEAADNDFYEYDAIVYGDDEYWYYWELTRTPRYPHN